MWGGITPPGPKQVKSGPKGEVGLFQDDQEENQLVRQPSNYIDLDNEDKKFAEILNIIQNDFIPRRQFSSKNNRSKWVKGRIKHLIGIKKGMYRRLKRGKENLRQHTTEFKTDLS